MKPTASILPGIKPVLEILRSDPRRVDMVFCRKGRRDREMLEIQSLCREAGIRFSLVEKEGLDRLCRDEETGRVPAHQGVAARVGAVAFHDAADLFAAVNDAPLPCILALDQVRDPGNVGTLCRTLHALGGAGLLVPLHNGAHLGAAAMRASAGALDSLPVARVTNLARSLDAAEEAGLFIYGASCDGDAANAFEEEFRLPAVIVLGGEEKGLRPGVAKRCARMLRIPLARGFDSLNVAQAGGILTALAARSRMIGS